MKELQQLLLKDDCYIPGYKNEDPADLARTAQVFAGSEKQPAANVINGVSRTVGEDETVWRAITACCPSNGMRPIPCARYA